MFKGDANKIYKYLKDYLKNNSTCEDVDEFILFELTAYIQTFLESWKKVQEHGPVQTFKNNASNVSGYFTAMNQSSGNIQRLCTRLGIYEIMKNKFLQLGKMTSEVKKRVA